MNKTIIININGIVFHIEEDAYEILKDYMTDVKRHFMNSADSLEITTDIENRIAEMFNEMLLREGKQVIVATITCLPSRNNISLNISAMRFSMSVVISRLSAEFIKWRLTSVM